MSIYDFNSLGEYVFKQTNKETIFRPSTHIIINEEFERIYLINGVCCIKHIKDEAQFYKQYKTLNGAKKYIDRWCKRIDASKITIRELDAREHFKAYKLLKGSGE